MKREPAFMASLGAIVFATALSPGCHQQAPASSMVGGGGVGGMGGAGGASATGGTDGGTCLPLEAGPEAYVCHDPNTPCCAGGCGGICTFVSSQNGPAILYCVLGGEPCPSGEDAGDG